MASTSQKRTARDFRRLVRLPEHRKGTFRRSLVSRNLRAIGVFLSCVLLGGVAFAGGGYLGLIERVREHGGVDLLGIMRALWVDIRAGEAVEDASTITQQYVRNACLSQDRLITRKIKE